MASLTAGTTFTDGVANDVTAAKLGALVTNATPTSGFIQDRTAETVVAVNDTLLIGDASDSNNLKRMTVANLLKAPLVSTSGTIDVLTTGTTTSTAEIVTSGTIATLNSTTSTITNLSATTSTFLGTITGSTNVINIGSGQIYKDASGKVLIGTTSNDTGGRLEVKQASSETGVGIQSSGTDDSKLYFRTASGTYGGDISFNGSYVKFSAGTTERMRIDSSGNLLVGTTDTSFSTGVGLKFRASATAPIMGYVMNTAGVETSYNLFNTNATNNGFRFYVNTNGGIANFSANNTTPSDERLKTNINLSGNYLDKICSIPVRTFNYRDQGEDTEKTIGVIAQEVEAHIPELINNDGFGETPADGIPLKTIYQTDLQYVLMRCIQELSAKVTALESA